MINFNKELGCNPHIVKIHRFRSIMSIYSKCDRSLWLELLGKRKKLILFNDICKKCLSTFNAEEIEDLKSYLVLRKLKG